MSYPIDFYVATSEQIEGALGERLEEIRLSRNLTQSRLAEEAGVSERTLRNLEKGEGVAMDTFVRVLMALGVQHHLEALLPDPSIRPVERAELAGKLRKRASSTKAPQKSEAWTWGDEANGDD
ncbi:MAG: helix-turn-helix transcriptional regulator [Verrucomicrobiales bacterium]|nr:helix-turn-helix transcriptional regulator [Verrucomicrobiales bacterium]